MSNQRGRIMLVKADMLSSYPQAFQDYVNKFFDPCNIGGVQYFFAFLTSDGDRTRYERRQKGVAPTSSFFSVEVDKDVSLFDWILKKCEDPKSGIIDLSRNWDDGCIGGAEVD